MIDWRLARIVAQGVVATQPAPAAGNFTAGLEAAAEESERVVSAYTGLVAAQPLPRAEAVGRSAWVEANLASLRTVMDPAAERIGRNLGALQGPARAAGSALLGVEVGAISGLLATRVLGQYEFAVLDPGAPARLLFVAPNLADAAASFEADADELLRWVALHETTHALQFGGVPWLREHFSGLVSELLPALDVDPRQLLRAQGRDLREMIRLAREEGLVSLVIGAERRGLLDRVQAFMAVIEGYAEHVMDAAGEELLPSLPELRAALERRRGDRSGLFRILERLLGLDMKLRQYQEGKVFCDAVVARGGIDALNRVWEHPGLMPALPELADPRGWLERTAPAAAA